MATTKFSRGHKKKPGSEPAKGRTEPAAWEKRQHAGKKTSLPKTVDVAKSRQHSGTSRGPAKQKEKREFRELRNSNIYRGATKPKTKHEKSVASRGKAIRKIAHLPKGNTPFQSVKQTGKIRDTYKRNVKQALHRVNKQLKKPELVDPKTYKELKSQKVALKAELDRLHGRKLKSEQKKVHRAHHALVKAAREGKEFHQSKQGFKALKEVKKEARSLKKTERKLGKQATKAFRQSHKKASAAEVLASEASVIPYAKGKPTIVPRVKGTQPKHPFETLDLAKIKQPAAAKKILFNVPSQKMNIPSSGSWTNFGREPRFGQDESGELDKRSIKILTDEAIKEQNSPSDVDVLVEAALLAPVPAGVLGKLGRGAKLALRLGEDASDAKSAVGALSKLETGHTTGTGAFKAIQEINATKKAIKDIKVIPGKGLQRRAGTGAAALGLELGRTSTPKSVITELAVTANSPTNKAMEKAASDLRVIAGGGEATDVNFQMMKDVASRLNPWKRSVGGLALRQKRILKYQLPYAAAVIGTSAVKREEAEKIQQDVHDIVIGAVPSTVQFLTASGDALLAPFGAGSTSRMKEMWKAVKETDPIALSLQGRFSEAEKAFAARPVSGLIEVGGAYSFFGKGAGMAARGLPDSIAPRLGKISGRKPIEIFGSIQDIRGYSKNLITKGLQKTGDSFYDSVLAGAEPKVITRKGKSTVTYGSKLKDKLAENYGQRQTIRLEHAIDEIHGMHVVHERNNKTEVEHQNFEILKQARKGRGRKFGDQAIVPIAMKVIRSPKTAIEDINKELDRLHTRQAEIKASHGHADHEMLTENITLLETLKNNPQLFKDDHLWKLADQFRQNEVKRQGELIALSAVNPKAAEFAPWITYVRLHMGGKYSPKLERFVRDGKELTLDQVKKHAELEGVVGEPAMITTSTTDGATMPGKWEGITNPNFHTWKSSASNIDRGIYDLNARSLNRQGVLTRSIIDKRRFYHTMLDKGLLRVKADQKPIYFEFKDRKAREKAAADGNERAKIEGNSAQEFTETHFGQHIGPELVPVNLKSFTEGIVGKNNSESVDWTSNEAAKKLGEDINRTLNKSLLEEFPDDNLFGLVPREMIERLNLHNAYENNVSSLLRRVNREFKGSVLAFSPKWHIGNIADMAMRLFFSGSGPDPVTLAANWTQGRRLLKMVKEFDKSGYTYNDLMSIIAGGHMAHGRNVSKELNEVSDRIFDAERSAQVRAATTAFRMGGHFYRRLQGGSFKIGSVIEEHLRSVALGKAYRDEALRLGNRWEKTIGYSPQVMKEVAEGIIGDSNVQRKMAYDVNKVMGDYVTLSPEARRAMLTFAPFLFWLRASTKWVLALPGRSPVRSSIVTSVNRLNEPERRMLGLSKFGKFDPSQVQPEYMLGSIPTSDPSKLYRTNAYTSFGPLTDLGGMAGFMLPQFENLRLAAEGKDWLGEEIVNSNGKPITLEERAGVLFQQALETYIAPLGLIHQGFAKGDPNESFSLLTNALHGRSPLAGFTKRKVSLQPGSGANYGKEVPVEAKEYPWELSATEGIGAKMFSPVYKSDNFVVQGRRQNKKYKLEKLKEEETGNESSGEWLSGKTESTKLKKRKKSPQAATKWLSE